MMTRGGYFARRGPKQVHSWALWRREGFVYIVFDYIDVSNRYKRGLEVYNLVFNIELLFDIFR